MRAYTLLEAAQICDKKSKMTIKIQMEKRHPEELYKDDGQYYITEKGIELLKQDYGITDNPIYNAENQGRSETQDPTTVINSLVVNNENLNKQLAVALQHNAELTDKIMEMQNTPPNQAILDQKDNEIRQKDDIITRKDDEIRDKTENIIKLTSERTRYKYLFIAAAVVLVGVLAFSLISYFMN